MTNAQFLNIAFEKSAKQKNNMAEVAEMAEKRENYATYAIYASANFYISGMACRRKEEKRKRGTKVPRTTKKEKPLGGLSAKRNRNGIIPLIRNEGYFTSWPWRVYTFSPRRMKTQFDRNLVQICTKIRIKALEKRNLVQICTKIRISICIYQKKVLPLQRF